MNYKPYLCISCSLTPGVKRWLKTFKESGVSSQVRLIIFMWQPYFDEEIKEILIDDDYVIYKQDSNYLGNKNARLPLYDLIKNKNLDDDWFIWTDCHDIIFQDKIPEFWINPDFKVLICSEFSTHEEIEFYWLKIIIESESDEFKHLLNKPIYNSGSFAMLGSQMMDYISELKIQSYYGRYGLDYDGDQLIFNKWIQNNMTICKVDKTIWLSLCYGLGKNGLLCDDKFITAKKTLFPIVHANGQSKDILNTIYKGIEEI
jgi:hypothetical protein